MSYHAVRAITDTMMWATFLLVFAITHEDLADWAAVGLIALSSWFGVSGARHEAELKRSETPT